MKHSIIRILFIFLGSALIVASVTVNNFFKPIADSFKKIAEIPNLFFIVVGIAVFIGVLHLFYTSKEKIANEHLIFKRLGPIVSSPITGATNGIFIHSGIQIIHVFCYNSNLTAHYKWLDKTTITITMIALITYGVFSMYLLINDIVKYDRNLKKGDIISEK